MTEHDDRKELQRVSPYDYGPRVPGLSIVAIHNSLLEFASSSDEPKLIGEARGNSGQISLGTIKIRGYGTRIVTSCVARGK